MLTIGNSSILSLLNVINKTSQNQINAMLQLSSGLKLNKGKDDPSGLIAYQNLGAELTAVEAAIENNTRSDAMLDVADGALSEITTLLQEVETLVLASSSDSGLTAGEKSANQAQIDEALQAIDRIVNTTSFNGKMLLNGNQAIQTTGVDSNTAEYLKVYTRSQSTSDTSVSVSVTQAATQATATLYTGLTGTLTSDVELEITGNLGSKTIKLTTGMNEAAVVAAIDSAQTETGVITDTSGPDLVLKSVGYGSDDYVQVTKISGTGGATAGTLNVPINKTLGLNAVVTINGQSVTADGKEVYYNSNGLSMSFSLGTSLDGVGETETFIVKASGGLTFQLGTSTNTRSTIGINSLGISNLGGGSSGGRLSEIKSGGNFALDKNKGETLGIVRKAIDDITGTQGRIGGFQKYAVQPAINSLTAASEGLTAARSSIGDADYAAATVELNKQTVLLQTGVSLLGIANQQASQLLVLLGL